MVSSFDKFTYEELEEIEGGVNLTVGKDKVINALEDKEKDLCRRLHNNSLTI